MSFDWKNFLELSRELLKTPLGKVDQEAQFRTVISRAYYSAYCSARRFIKSVDSENFPKIDGTESHRRLIDYFSHRKEAQSRSIFNQLNALKTYRQKADYESSYPSVKFEAELAITKSGAVLSSLADLERILNGPTH